MELSSFKAVLLRKAQGNNSLQTFIKNIDDERFADTVIEVLEKMPRATKNTGSKANAAVSSFGNNASVFDVNMMRDALGHHLSHYKAALKAHHAAPEGSPEKAKYRQVADAHMDHLFPIMHLAARAAKHSTESDNPFDLDFPHIPPWETNYTTLEPNKKKDGPNRDPKLLRVRTKNSGSISKNTKDWGFLEMPPHPGHKDSAAEKASGYPWENIQLGKPSDIDAKRAYVHIEDVAPKPEFTPHEFDYHPIRGVADVSPDHFSPNIQAKYDADIAAWEGGEHRKKWVARMRSLPPGDWMSRGTVKAPHFYDGIPLRKHPDHVHAHMKKLADKAAAAVPPASSATPAVPTQLTATASPTSAVAPTIRSNATQGPTSSPAASAGAVNPSIRPQAQQTASQPAASTAPKLTLEQVRQQLSAPLPVKPAVKPAAQSGQSHPDQEHMEAKSLHETLQSMPEDTRNKLMSNPAIMRMLLKLKDK